MRRSRCAVFDGESALVAEGAADPVSGGDMIACTSPGGDSDG